MNISTKTRYGSRIMVELAEVYPDETVSVKRMAEHQELSAKYLEQIVAALKAADLIRAVRGMGGGYALTRPPEQIRMLDIFLVLEGSPAVVECVDRPEHCPRHEICPVIDLWRELAEATSAILGRTTLRDLVNRADQLPKTRKA